MTEEAKQDEPTRAKKAPAAAKEVSQMDPGDYTLHLFFQKAKDLEIDAEDAINVNIEVEVQGRKEVSNVIENVTSSTICNFGHHIFIELFKQSVAQLEQTKIMVKLCEKGFFKASPIGQVELDLTYLYNLKDHTQEHQWLAMINPDSEDFSSVSAYLKMSASVYGVKDTPKELKLDENEDDDNCIMPASIKPKYSQLKMHIVKGEHLPKLDVKLIGEGTMDAFIRTKVGSKKLKTRIIETKHDEATWNQTFLIPVRLPIMTGKLILDVMDLDNVTDEQAGALIFDFKDLLSRESGSFFWANIYGAPGQEEVKLIDSSSNVADEMNKDPTKATAWKGRILIGVEHEENVETPRSGVESMSTSAPLDKNGDPIMKDGVALESIVTRAQNFIRQKKYHIMYEFGTCNNIPEKLGKFNLQLKIGEHTWTSKNGEKDRAIGYNYNRWNQKTLEPEEVELPYGEVDEMDEIFLYLVPDKGGLGGVFGGGKDTKVGKPISYCKLRASDFMDPNPKLQWVEMTTEPIEDKVKPPELAGVVSFRLSIVEAGTVDFKQQPLWNKKKQRRPESAKIRVYLFQCKDLPAADEDGASDPIVSVFNSVHQDKEERMLKEIVETEMIENNCDPMFYELLELNIDYNKDEELPPFIFDIYDIDATLIGKPDRDYIGRAVIKLEDTAHKQINEDTDTVDLKPEIPKWHPIRYAAGQPKCGSILVSFIIAEANDHVWKKPSEAVEMMGMSTDEAVVRFEDYRVEFNVLGLRNLASPGLLPVKKAYIDFLLKSMVPPMAATALSSIQTAPGPSGPNPTINSVISFDVPMPCDPLYAPSMACRVYDKVFKGFSGQLIGVFTIPIGQIMIDQKEEYQKNCEDLDYVIAELEKVLSGEAVLDYDPVNKAVDENLIEDKQFRETQKKEKDAYNKAMAKPAPGDAKSFQERIADKIAPEPVKPTTALQKRLADGKSSALKRRLLIHADEDDDSDGETYTNPVAKSDTEKMKYVPPSLDLGAINDSQRFDMNALSATPRSQLSTEEKQVVDRAAILDAISDKSDPDKLKKLMPKQGEKFAPPTATRITKGDVEKAIRLRSGASTPVSSNHSIKQFNSAKSGISNQLIEMAKDEEAAIQRQITSERQDAEKALLAKSGGKEIKLIDKPKYKLDTRLNCYREVDIPDNRLFEPLGWDRDPENPSQKHYRKFVTNEMETVTEIMSKPSEFHCYELKRGQTRGASSSGFSLFSSAKKDQATGEEDTTTSMGLFKALITVTQKDIEGEQKMFMMQKLSKIRVLLSQIYSKQYKGKEFPVKEGFFCEDIFTGSKILNAGQRERAYSDDIKMPGENDIVIPSSGYEDQTFTNRTTQKSFRFDGLASTILNNEGRALFKGLMREMKLTHLQILRKVVDVQSDEIIKRLLMQETKCNVRCYMVRAFNLAERDNDSPSDPYVKLILGEEVRDERENYQVDNSAPDIYKMFEFQAVFPGCPLLKVEFWDYDMLFGDDLIGVTVIDLEDRYFSSDFRSFMHKPIEHRRLSHPSTEMSQGTAVLWTEINDQYASKDSVPVYDISKKPEEEFEVRVIIWDTEELEIMDAEGTTDGFVRCFFDSGNAKDTDTHFRNSDGKCSWNYRILFPFNHPSTNYELTVQAYDLDLFKSNDLIGQTTIDLKELIQDSELAKRPISLTTDYYDQYLHPEKKMKRVNDDNEEVRKQAQLTFEKEDKRQFWVNLSGKNKDGKQVVMGRLKMSIEVFPKKEAEANPVGAGQSEPNINPFLPKPFGRIEFSLNPFKMLAQLVGPAFLRKMYCYCICALCCALCVMMAPMIFSNLFVNMITPG